MSKLILALLFSVYIVAAQAITCYESNDEPEKYWEQEDECEACARFTEDSTQQVVYRGCYFQTCNPGRMESPEGEMGEMVCCYTDLCNK